MDGFVHIGRTISKMQERGELPSGMAPTASPATKAGPVVLVDTREQTPLKITQYPVEVVGLRTGDYGVRGFSDLTNPRFIIERKSLADLCGSLGKGRIRFMEEMERMREFTFRALVIEAAVDEVECSQ